MTTANTPPTLPPLPEGTKPLTLEERRDWMPDGEYRHIAAAACAAE